MQILEDGVVTDGKGRTVNFKNTIIIMTSNIGSDEFNAQAEKIGFSLSEKEEEKLAIDTEEIEQKVLKQLPDYFSPEFLNRIDKTIVFSPLDKKVIRSIITLQLDLLVGRLHDLGIECTYDAKAVNLILSETYNPVYGARPIRRYIQDKIEDAVAENMLNHRSKKHVDISAQKKELQFSWR